MSKPSLTDYALLIGVGISWGSQFFFNQLAIETLPPLLVASGRVTIGCIFLTLLLRFLPKTDLKTESTSHPWGAYALIGIVEAVLPCFLIPWGQQYVNASIAAILLAMVPIFTLILAPIFIAGEAWSRHATLAVLLGFLGIVVLVDPWSQERVAAHYWGEAAILGGALSFSASMIMMKRLPDVAPVEAIRNIFFTASIPLLTLAIIWEHPWKLSPSSESLLAMITLGILCGGIAYVMFIRLLKRTGPTFTSLCNYLVTLSGVFLGVLILGDRLGIHDLFALILILAGLVVYQRRRAKLVI